MLIMGYHIDTNSGIRLELILGCILDVFSLNLIPFLSSGYMRCSSSMFENDVEIGLMCSVSIKSIYYIFLFVKCRKVPQKFKFGLDTAWLAGF